MDVENDFSVRGASGKGDDVHDRRFFGSVLDPARGADTTAALAAAWFSACHSVALIASDFSSITREGKQLPFAGCESRIAAG